MALHVWPLRALVEEVESVLASAAAADEVDAAPHFIGEKHLAAHGTPPRYVWVARSLRPTREAASQSEEEIRSVGQAREHVSIYCWGGSDDQASAMRSNVFAAAKRVAAQDVQLEGGDWVGPGEAWNQKGECFRLEVSLELPFIDAFVPLPTLEQPEASLAEVEAVEAEIYKSPDLETDGDAFVSVTIEEP